MDFTQEGSAYTTNGGNVNSGNTLHFHSEKTQLDVHVAPPKPVFRGHLRCPRPSPQFVGRKEELLKICKFFASAERGPKIFALTGMGGCGKSQIASQLVHGYILDKNISSTFQYNSSKVFFVDASTIMTLEESYAAIAKCEDVGSTAQDALNWLANLQEPSFILIDNADNPNLDLNAWLPRSNEAHILITTRLQGAKYHYASKDGFIDLDALPIGDAEELLIQTAMLPREQVGPEISVLVKELHYHALAIAQAGACIAFLHLTVNEYLERFRRLGTSLMDGNNDGVDSSALHGYSKVVSISWKTSYDELPPLSRELFNLCAFLHHTGVTQVVFQKATEALKNDRSAVPFSPAEEAAFTVVTRTLKSCRGDDKSLDNFAFQKCKAPILSLSLMRCDPVTGVLSIHPLVSDSLQRAVADHLPASILLMLAINSDLQDATFLHHLLPHVDGVASRFTTDNSTEPSQCHPDIAEAFSFVYSKSGRHKEAEKLRLYVRYRCKDLLPKNHPRTVWAMRNLANCWSDLGQHEKAEKVLRDVRFKRKKSLGEDHPLTLWAMSELANCWSELGRHKDAENLQRCVLSRRIRLLGEEHPETVWTMRNLAVCCSNIGRHGEAETIRLDVLSLRRRLLGEDHPDTVWAKNELADCWSNLGRHDEAKEVRKDILSRRRRLLGEDHPETVWAMNDLANCWSDLGRYEEAETLRLEVLSKRRRLLGEGYPDTVKSMSLLAFTYAHLQRFQEAEKLSEEALSRQKRVFGENHPHTIRFVQELTWISAEREANIQLCAKENNNALESSVQSMINSPANSTSKDLPEQPETHPCVEVEPQPESRIGRVLLFVPLLLVSVLVLARRRS